MLLSKTKAETIAKQFIGNEYNTLLVQVDDNLLVAVLEDTEPKLLCIGSAEVRLIQMLQAEREQTIDGVLCKLCSLTNINAELVRRNIKWAAPSVPMKQAVRAIVGTADSETLKVLAKQKCKPVFSPESNDEKNYRGFLDKLTWMVVANGYKQGYSADAGLLHTEEEVVGALVLGYSQITLDCAAKINKEIAGLSVEQVDEEYAALPEDFRSKLEDSYLEKKFKTADGKIKFELADLKRIALTYAEVIVYVRYVYSTYLNNTPWPVDFVISVKNADIRLTEQAHYLILNELERLGAQVKAILK